MSVYLNSVREQKIGWLQKAKRVHAHTHARMRVLQTLALTGPRLQIAEY